MEEEYNLEIALEVIQLKISNLINTRQVSYDNFKKKLAELKENERKIYNMDKEIIDQILKEYKNNLNGGINCDK